MSDLRTAAQQALEAIDWLRLHLQRDHQCLHMDPTGSGISNWLNKTEAALCAALAEPVQEPVSWSDADADAARLAMELEALLLSCKDTAAVSSWWDSAHDALELHRQRLSMNELANQQKTSGSPCPTCEALARAVMMDQTGKA